MAPRGRGGRGGRRGKGGRGKQQTHHQNNPASSGPNPAVPGNNPTVPVPVPNPAVPGPNPAVPGPGSNPAAPGSNPAAPGSNLAVPGTNPAAPGSNPGPRPRREFPHKVIWEILTRLPVKSVLRFAFASKSWRTMVSLRRFAGVHLNRSPGALLLRGDNAQAPGHIAYSLQPPTSRRPSGAFQRINFPGVDGAPAELNFFVGTAQNGVACLFHDDDDLAQNLTLWNPATRSSLRIPVPETPNPDDLFGASAGFGYNMASDVYAIIRIVRYNEPEQPDVAYLFNLETGRWDKWGKVHFRVMEVKCNAVVTGVPYWKALDDQGGLLLAWFNVRSWDFQTEYISRWVRPETREFCLSEVRSSHLGAIVWERAEEGNLPNPVLEVWTRSRSATTGEWELTNRFDPVMNLPVFGRVMGFYWWEQLELVQEIIIPAENPKPTLWIIQLGDVVRVRCCCKLDGMSIGSCEVMRYRESLARLPKIGSAMI